MVATATPPKTTRYLVDTNVISELGKREPSERALSWMEENSNELCLSAITVKELYFGTLSLPDGKRKERLLATVENIVWLYEKDIFAFDREAAVICARLHDTAKQSGRTPQIEDLMIAAICIANNLTLATRNVRDFEYLGVPFVNPFA